MPLSKTEFVISSKSMICRRHIIFILFVIFATTSAFVKKESSVAKLNQIQSDDAYVVTSINLDYAENFFQDVINSNRKIVLSVAEFTLKNPIIIEKYVEIVSNHGGRTAVHVTKLTTFPIIIRNSGFVEMTGLYFENPDTNSELVALLEESTLTLKSCTFSSVRSEALISSIDSILAMDDCLFQNVESIRGGSILSLNSEIAIKNSFFDGNTNRVLSLIESKVTIEGTTFYNNLALSYLTENSGGSVAMIQNSVVTIDSCLFYFNQAYGNGGVIWIDTADVTLNKVTFENNVCYDNGGIIFFANSKLEITESSIESSLSKYFGGALFSASSTLVVDSVIALNNSAVASGGFIYSESSDITIQNSSIGENKAHAYGGVAALSNSILYIEKSMFNNNVGSHCAAIYYVGSNATIQNSEFIYNVSPNCGGVYRIENSNVTTMNSYYLYNSGGNGGVVCVYGGSNYFSSACTYLYNKANASGGVCYLSNDGFYDSGSFQKCIVEFNSAVVNGPDFYDNNPAENDIIVDDCTVRFNYISDE